MRDGGGAIKHVVRMVGFELFRPKDSTRVLTGSVKIGARPEEEEKATEPMAFLATRTSQAGQGANAAGKDFQELLIVLAKKGEKLGDKIANYGLKVLLDCGSLRLSSAATALQVLGSVAARLLGHLP